MKHYIFIIILFLGVDVSYSQNIIAITFADTDDMIIGNGCAIDQKNFRSFYKRLGKSLGMKVIEKPFSNDDFNTTNFDEFSQSLETTSEDIILFYNTCHGERSVYDKLVYPQLRFQKDLRSVYYKHELIAKLPHKNIITFVDACNVERNIRPQEQKIFAKVYSPVPKGDASSQEIVNAKKVFKNRFDIIVTSSEPGVTSVTTSQGGSIFTNCFLSSFYYYMQQQNLSVVTIKNILLETQKQTFAESKRIYANNQIKEFGENRAHTPKFEIILKSTPSDSIAESIPDLSLESYELNFVTSKLSFTDKISNGTISDYKVVITVGNSMGSMGNIKSVRYFFHDNFLRPTVVPTDVANNYVYTIFVYKEFMVKAEITLNTGRILNISKLIDFDGEK